MATKHGRSAGPAFGDGGGTNVADYLELFDRVVEAERREDAGERIAHIPVDRIDRSPYQVRVDFDAEQLDALAEDVEANGLNHAITVRAKPDGCYELVAGERRWLAVRAAGRKHVQARIRELDDFDAHLVGVSENNQRADLSPWERALEALELHRHVVASGRPHAQRDLARYLGRNVTAVNQQLAIADAITAELIATVDVDAQEVCTLSHETLHRVAKLAPVERARALEDAVRKGGVSTTARTTRNDSAEADNTADRWTSLWETGGFHVHIRKPLRDVEPRKAQKYLQDLLPGICGLADRAAHADGVSAAVRWEHQHGRLIFVPPARALTVRGREVTSKFLRQMLAELAAT